MKYILKFFEIILNPLYSIMTANKNSANGKIRKITKNPFFLLFISALITAGIMLIAYRNIIFGA